MESKNPSNQVKRPTGPNIFEVLKPYRGMVVLLIAFALLSNGFNLVLPKIISGGIDAFTNHTLVMKTVIMEFFGAGFLIFLFAYLQSIVQVYASERVAKDLRESLSAKISRQSYNYIQTTNPSKLLTNLTSDIDSIKLFVSQAVVSLVSSVFLLLGASILLLRIDWKLALAVLAILPIIAITFFVVLGKVRALFMKSREIIDWLNKVINESILGASLIRVLNSEKPEAQKFLTANTNAKDLGMRILNLFASMIPIVTFVSNLATLIIVVLGGHFVISGNMSLGDLAAFNSYLALLIFPIFVIGFMSGIITQATTSYQRIREVLDAPEVEANGAVKATLRGEVELKDVSVLYGERAALKHVSFDVKPGTKTAIIGPTAAGKSQLLHLLTGLIKPTGGVIEFDGRPVEDYDRQNLHQQIGFVFQDSIIFNMSVRENIAFSDDITDESLEKAIQTAELGDFIETLPNKLDTVVSERGSSLSGGQKQRIMLARALSLNPKVLLLDDFTARVDTNTEQRILKNLEENYPGITLISVTQKIASIEHYDQIVLLMEGELIATGTHEQLLKSCPEYVQIYNSQRSTSHYELHAE